MVTVLSMMVMVWAVYVASVFAALAAADKIPLQFDAPFGSYPNLLDITEEERNSFSPIVIFPKKRLMLLPLSKRKSKRNNNNNNNNNGTIQIPVKDHRRSSGELATQEEIAILRAEKSRRRRQQQQQQWKSPWRAGTLIQNLMRFARCIVGRVMILRNNNKTSSSSSSSLWGIGKYDENRDGGMYESDLFDDLNNTIDGYGGRRTVHLGIDLGGPVGTPVRAFTDGIVHSVGYNSELGDYGHVIVIEHFLGRGASASGISSNTSVSASASASAAVNNNKTCWALYGHLDESVLTTTSTSSSSKRGGRRRRLRRLLQRRKVRVLVKPGDFIKKGQVIGRIGDIDENGGWVNQHLHFQLSTKPPDQPHDMPGASSVKDRTVALNQYLDPRYVLGPIY